GVFVPELLLPRNERVPAATESSGQRLESRCLNGSLDLVSKPQRRPLRSAAQKGFGLGRLRRTSSPDLASDMLRQLRVSGLVGRVEIGHHLGFSRHQSPYFFRSAAASGAAPCGCVVAADGATGCLS